MERKYFGKLVYSILLLIFFSDLYSQQSIWTIRNPLPSNAHLENVMWDGNRFIAVGVCGTIITSDEGTVWTRQNSGTCNYLNGITKRDEQIVVSGAAGNILTSSDGVTWTSKTVCDCPIYSILWADNQFVAVGSGNYEEAVILTSPDGVSWNKDTVCQNNVTGDIIWTGNQLVCPCLDTILTSQDCITWSKHYTGDGIIIINVAWSGQKYVGVARNQISTSLDCKTWTEQSVNFDPGDYITSVIWDGSQFILTMYNNYYSGKDFYPDLKKYSVNQIMTSSDGISWTKHNTGTKRNLTEITKGNNKYVAVGREGSIISSSDGDNWTQHCKGSILKINDIIWSGEQVIAVGDSGLVLTSKEGIEWAKQSVNTNLNLACIEWTGEQFVVGCIDGFRKKQSEVGSEDSLILTSPDGINWEKHYAIDSVEDIYSVISWTENRLIAIGPEKGPYLNTVVLCSSDGKNWEKYSTIEDVICKSITWTGKRFVAGGYYGGNIAAKIVISTDGKSWVEKFVKDTSEVTDIVWTGSTLAATLTRSIITSTDEGISWTEHTGTGWLYGITWTGDVFIAVGVNGWIVTSTDGLIWKEQLPAPATNNSLYCVTYTDKYVIAAGDIGTIITCPISGVGIKPVQQLSSSNFSSPFSIKSITRNYIYFSCNFKNTKPLHVELYNLHGQKLFYTFYENASTLENLYIPINEIAPGIYYLRVKAGKISEVQKMIIGAF